MISLFQRACLRLVARLPLGRPIKSLLVLSGAGLLLITASPGAVAEPPLPIAELERTEPVRFEDEILPILKRNCLACHQKSAAEGGLILETLASIQAGGDSGPAIVPSDSAASLLLARAVGADDSLMPPEDNTVGASPLTPEQLGLLKRWIDEGAMAAASEATESMAWQPLASSMRPIYTLDISPEGQYAAFGRGNRVVISDLSQQAEIAELVDPSVTPGPAADVDLIQSIAFSPNGERIATGGFRTVKIWKKVWAPSEASGAPLEQADGLLTVQANGTTAAWRNAVGELEIWDLTQNSKLAAVTDLGSALTATAWAGAESRVFTGTEAGRLAVWDTTSGTALAHHDLPSPVVRLAASPDGTSVAALTQDRHVQLLRFVAASESAPAALELVQASVAGVLDAIDVVMLSQPVLALLIATESRGVLVVDAASQAVLRTIDHGAPVNALAVTDDQLQLVTGGRDGKAKLWTIADGTLLTTFEGTPATHRDVARATRDSARQKARIAKLTARTAELAELLKKEDEALAMINTARDQAVAADTKSKASLAEAAEKLKADQAKFDQLAAAATQAAELSATANQKLEQAVAATQTLTAEIAAKTAMLEAVAKTEAATPERASDAPAPVADAAAKERLTTEIAEATARLKQAEELVVAQRAEVAKATEMVAQSKAAMEAFAKELEAHKKVVATAEEAQRASAAELQKQQLSAEAAKLAQQRAAEAVPAHQASFDAANARLAELEQALAAAQQQLAQSAVDIVGIGIDAGAKQVATLHGDGSKRIYRLPDGQPILIEREAATTPRAEIESIADRWCYFGATGGVACWPRQPRWVLERVIGSIDDDRILSDRVTALDFHRDAETLAVGTGSPSRSGAVKIFAVESGEMVRDFGEIHTDTVLGLAFSPDGELLASASSDRTIRLLDVASGSIRGTLEGHTHHVMSVAWQDDGRTLASSGADQSVRIWDSETGETARTLTGFPQEVTSIAFVQATQQLVAASGGGQIRLADASNGQTVRSFQASDDFLFTVGVTPDGTRVVAGGQSGTLRLWNLADGVLVAELK